MLGYGTASWRIWLVTALLFQACAKPKANEIRFAASEVRYIRAFLLTPISQVGGLNGIWSADATELETLLRTKSPKQSIQSDSTRYFLRIEKDQCDELFFVNKSQFMVSAGTLKKLETAKRRIDFSVVFSRDEGGLRRSQGAILTAYADKKKIELTVDGRKLTFSPETHSVENILSKLGIAPLAK